MYSTKEKLFKNFFYNNSLACNLQNTFISLKYKSYHYQFVFAVIRILLQTDVKSKKFCDLYSIHIRCSTSHCVLVQAILLKVCIIYIKCKPLFNCFMCKRVSTVLYCKPLRSPGIDSIDSARCSLAGRYDNPICRTGPPAESIPGLLKSLPIPAQCETCWRKYATFTVKRFKTKLLRLVKKEKN
jgi:hypothetical protein